MKLKANEIQIPSFKLGTKYVIKNDLGVLNKEDIVEVINITVYNLDIQIILQNQNGIQEIITLDKNDDVKLA
jgi:hypothetical protein